MARTHRQTISWPIPLWREIEAEAHRRGMSPNYFIITTMDSLIHKSQEDQAD